MISIVAPEICRRQQHKVSYLRALSALALIRRNVLDLSRKLCMSGTINGSMLNFGARRIFAKIVVAVPIPRWPDRSRNESPAAVWADIAQDVVDAPGAKRAFISAYPCLKGGRRQGLVAVFTSRAELEHRFLSGDG